MDSTTPSTSTEPKQPLQRNVSKQKMMKVLGVSGDVFEAIYHAPGARKSKVVYMLAV